MIIIIIIIITIGSIPLDLGQLRELKELHLNGNALTGNHYFIAVVIFTSYNRSYST